MKPSYLRIIALITAVYTITAHCADDVAAKLNAKSGLQPSSSVVIVEESTGEGQLIVSNPTGAPLLMHTTLRRLPNESETMIIAATPQIAKIDPTKGQVVRFFLTSKEKLLTQRLFRVSVEGLPITSKSEKPTESNKIIFSVKHDLPVIVNPKSLAKNDRPWELLKATIKDGGIQIENPSKYVVRLSQNVAIGESKTRGELPKPYILPGETVRVKSAEHLALPVEIYPASVYGYYADKYSIK
jgi:P pilus assembly chaperone PapD